MSQVVSVAACGEIDGRAARRSEQLVAEDELVRDAAPVRRLALYRMSFLDAWAPHAAVVSKADLEEDFAEAGDADGLLVPAPLTAARALTRRGALLGCAAVIVLLSLGVGLGVALRASKGAAAARVSSLSVGSLPPPPLSGPSAAVSSVTFVATLGATSAASFNQPAPLALYTATLAAALQTDTTSVHGAPHAPLRAASCRRQTLHTRAHAAPRALTRASLCSRAPSPTSRVCSAARAHNRPPPPRAAAVPARRFRRRHHPRRRRAVGGRRTGC